MPIRPAVYSDLLPASKFLAKAFKDEDLFGVYMHPRRNEYPDDMYLHFLNKLRIGWASGPNNHFLVSYKKDDRGREILTGIARWQRLSATNAVPNLYTTASLNAMKAYIWCESFIYPNRAADLSRTGILAKMGPFVGHHWTGTRSEVWDLDFLGVDPDQGGQGFGRELVEWGFEQARKDGVGCSVISSDGKERFYQSCGFDVVVGTVRDFGGDANPIKREGITGGTILFWDNGVEPKGIKEYSGI
jgi:GNAT superfamily N-acetyltransferase